MSADSKKTPEYIRLYEKFKREITNGAYPYGAKLPSKRDTAAKNGVSVITAEHAYALLEDEGYIVCRQRSGCFSAYRDDQLFKSNPSTGSVSGVSVPGSARPHALSPMAAHAHASPVHDSPCSPARAAAPDAAHSSARSLAPDAAYSPTRLPSPDAARPSAPVPGAAPVSAAARRPAGAVPAEDITFPAGLYAKTVRSVLTKYGGDILKRTDGAGLPRLRCAVAKYLIRAREIEVSPDDIVIGSGAEALYQLAIMLIGSDRIYAIETPSYDKIEKTYRARGINCLLLPLSGDGIPDSVLSSCAADVLHVTPYHSFPSGITATAAKKKAYLEWAKSRGAVIIEDDFGSEFCRSRKPTDTLFETDGGERVLYINTFSKTLSPALRVGYMLLPRALQVRRKNIEYMSCSVPVLDQYILCELLDGGSFERHLNRIRRQIRKENRR